VSDVLTRAKAQLRRLPRRVETPVFWLVVAPLLARLPASLAYRAACWRADWVFRNWPEEFAGISRNASQILGEDFSPAEANRLARELVRCESCEIIDVMRLHGRARSLTKLVEVRGREHLDAALAEGKGAILCSAHFGSYLSSFSVIHASGIPVTTIGRWWWDYTPGVSSAARRFWNFVHARRVMRHRQRPNIQPWPGRIQVGVQAAAALGENEVVTICSDPPPQGTDRARAIEVPFLGQPATLLPGVVTLARLTGAPVLMTFMHRSADHRHQVLEISPPVSMEGETATSFGRCVAAIEAAVRTSPAQWHYWSETEELVALGLLPGTRPSRITAA
jgi:lauroyl/myristoyl acyltransferase